MNNSSFFCDDRIPNLTQLSSFCEKLESLSITLKAPIYLLSKALGSDTAYSYSNAIILLLPKHYILVIDRNIDSSNCHSNDFEDFFEDFIEDLGYLSEKYGYRQWLGRPREWKGYIHKCSLNDISNNLEPLITRKRVPFIAERRVELLISLLIGSINDPEKVGVETPNAILDKVKKKIVLFDGMQSRFIYGKVSKKRVTIQGLAGTGKTELLLHKLQKLYTKKSNSKIAFTCYNKVLANDMQNRIPQFFDFMRVEKQIEWNKRLWVCRSWGSASDCNSGLYSFICSYYNLPFHRYNESTSFDAVCREALERLQQIPNFEPCFDYILVDESQDFSSAFFDLCEYVVKCQVYLAGDIFQNIFDSDFGNSVNCDYLLNKCYRTNPHTLMFAHAVGMGLYEKPVIRWLEDDEWEACGYQLQRTPPTVSLYRSPVHRFGDTTEDSADSVEVIGCTRETMVDQIISTIERIYEQNPSVEADDIAVIFTSNNKQIFSMADALSIELERHFSIDVTQGHVTKNREKGKLYISNINNVKGLEFPFVICVHVGRVKTSISSRNSIYMALTRSFLTSYFIVDSSLNEFFLHTYETAAKDIIESDSIVVTEPTAEEKAMLKENIRIATTGKKKSLEDLISETCLSSPFAPNITPSLRDKINRIVPNLIDDETEEEIITSTNRAIEMLMEKYK